MPLDSLQRGPSKLFRRWGRSRAERWQDYPWSRRIALVSDHLSPHDWLAMWSGVVDHDPHSLHLAAECISISNTSVLHHSRHRACLLIEVIALPSRSRFEVCLTCVLRKQIGQCAYRRATSWKSVLFATLWHVACSFSCKGEMIAVDGSIVDSSVRNWRAYFR